MASYLEPEYRLRIDSVGTMGSFVPSYDRLKHGFRACDSCPTVYTSDMLKEIIKILDGDMLDGIKKIKLTP